jgi:hypothetical protein
LHKEPLQQDAVTGEGWNGKSECLRNVSKRNPAESPFPEKSRGHQGVSRLMRPVASAQTVKINRIGMEPPALLALI